MPFKQYETPKYHYILYVKKSSTDLNKLKTTLNSLTSGINTEAKDIVVDFNGSKLIYSNEIGVLIHAVKNLGGSQRRLIVITTPTIKKIIDSTNMPKVHNLVFDVNEEVEESLSETNQKSSVEKQQQEKTTPVQDNSAFTKLLCPTCCYEIWTTPRWIAMGKPTCPCGNEFREA